MLGLGASSCPEKGPELRWSGQLWRGDARTYSLVRSQNRQVVQMYCGDPAFDRMLCIADTDYQALQQQIVEIQNKCEKWKD